MRTKSACFHESWLSTNFSRLTMVCMQCGRTGIEIECDAMMHGKEIGRAEALTAIRALGGAVAGVADAIGNHFARQVEARSATAEDAQ